MSKYFGNFEKINYSVANNVNDLTSYVVVTNVMQGTEAVVEPYLRDRRNYAKYNIQDGMRPDQVAHSVYGDATKHWLVLMSNKIMDPQFDWLMDGSSLDNFIEQKYGSLENAQSLDKITVFSNVPGAQTVYPLDFVVTDANNILVLVQGPSDPKPNTIGSAFAVSNSIVTLNDAPDPASNVSVIEVFYHAYYKTIEQESSVGGTITHNVEIDPVEYYTMDLGVNEVVTFTDGETLERTTNRDAITRYDYEVELNDSRREIVLINTTLVSEIETKIQKLNTVSNGLRNG